MQLIKAIKTRKSIRAFSSQSIENDKISLLFEAARWAPSSRNEQPWEYYYAVKENKAAFDKFMACLNPGNRWAENAAMIILALAKRNSESKSKPNKYFMYDVGAANISLAMQAAEMGLQAHQMGGFDRDATIKTFNLDVEHYEPASYLAIGYPADPETLDEETRKKESAIRIRKKVTEFVHQIES